MVTMHGPEGHYTFNDGLGVRTVASDPRHGVVEVLTVSPVLANHPAGERAIRACAGRYDDVDRGPVNRVHAIDRDDAALRVVTEWPQGVRLSDVLTELTASTFPLCDAGILELAYAVVRAVGALHHAPGGVSHGAISPAHIIIGPRGSATLTDSIFGGAIEALEANREAVWRQFGVAMPPSASVPRFDRRSDVSQLGAVVLAIALRAPLTPEAYPREIPDLVLLATPDSAHHGSALRMWLQQALHLHPRSTFASAVDAQAAFAALMPAPGIRRTGREALQAVLGRAASFFTVHTS
jgi:hypothetical protein